MNERVVANAVFYDVSGRSQIVVPNFTPRDWYECDVFSITKAGYMVEYEIKLTVSDFKADTRKGRVEWKRKDGPWIAGAGLRENYDCIQESKHARISAADPNGPSRFFYVVPRDLLKPEEVPAWAGLKYAMPHGRRAWIKTIKQAPRIHNATVDTSVADYARQIMYWRYWNLRIRNVDAAPQSEQTVGHSYGATA